MTYLKAASLGIIQGLTEFLPISSSAHLVIFQKLLAITEPPVVFDLMLHLGTLVAIGILFHEDIRTLLKTILPLCRAFVKGRGKAFISQHREGRFIYLIVVTTVVTGILGMLTREYIERAFHHTRLVGMMLVITGCVLCAAVIFGTERKDSKKMSLGDAVVIGIVQALALLPGISRSGVTISIGMLLGISRLESMRYSFLIAIPAIIGAWFIESVGHLIRGSIQLSDGGPYLVGTALSIAVGYGALRILRSMLTGGKFMVFIYYCWIVGIIIMVV